MFNLIGICKTCGGSGKTKLEIDLIEIFEMIKNNPANKIATIKQVRAEYNLGLKEAKNIVEATMVYLDNLNAIEGVQIPTSTGYYKSW